MSTGRVVVNVHCLRHFVRWNEPGQVGLDATTFAERVNAHVAGGGKLREGYAPFCKHVIMENFTACKPFCAPITPQNEQELRSDYASRSAAELPVLRRYFPRESMPNRPAAKYLDVILYSKEQIEKEERARGQPAQLDQDYAWGIVSFKAQDEGEELPMQPITMMRNALGAEEGGSGESLNREKYLAAVAFWSEHAEVI